MWIQVKSWQMTDELLICYGRVIAELKQYVCTMIGDDYFYKSQGLNWKMLIHGHFGQRYIWKYSQWNCV